MGLVYLQTTMPQEGCFGVSPLLTRTCLLWRAPHVNAKRGGLDMKTQPNTDQTRQASFLLWLKALPVLRLTFRGNAWELEYTAQFKAQSRLLPIVCFPEVDKVYRSGKLWPFFFVRIPSIARPDVQRTVREEHLDYDDVAAMLRRFGRKSVADPFELRPDPDVEQLQLN